MTPGMVPRIGRGRRGIGFWFWATILALLGATLLLVAIAALGRPAGPDDAAARPRSSITQDQLDRITREAHQAGLSALQAGMDPVLDAVFAPVHAAIPAYADFHYSVWGQYAELGTAALEAAGFEQQVYGILRKHLFEGHDARLVEAVGQAQEIYEAAARDSLRRSGEALSPGGWTGPAATALEDARRRMRLTAPAGFLGGLGTAAIAKPIAGKILASTAVKAAAKGAGKVTGIGGTAAAGAAAGSLLGPVGAAAGGIGGAVLGWLIVDQAVIGLDEYFNRADFEAELCRVIEAERARLRDALLSRHGATLSTQAAAPDCVAALP